LASKGVEVTVVTQVPRTAELPARDEHLGYTIERHYLPLGEIFDVPSPAAARAARVSRRFDVIWLHNYHAPLAWLASEQAKAPIVLSPWYHGVGHTRMRDALHRFYRPAGRRLMGASRRIFAASEAEADLILRDFPRHVDSDKITMTPVAVEDPVRGRQPYPGVANVVLTVARQEPYKRTDVLIRAVVELRSRGVPAHLVVVGDGSALAASRQLATRLGADDLVTFTGAADDETLARWWASASLLATASLHEAFGIVLAQALVGGIPAVASAIPAHRDIIRLAGPDAIAELCDVDLPDIETATRYADAMARLLRRPNASRKPPTRCALPSADEMADRLLETLTAVVQ
jgi:glycosyltransferase involved in cell wall biosynthesis